MLYTATVTTNDELQQILSLNERNLKHNVSASDKQSEGFVTWLYTLPLLQKMHALMPSIIAKDDDNRVVGYALTTLKESVAFHPDLQKMMHDLQQLEYNGKPLFSYNLYCIGQVCIDKNFRGKGLLNLLYQTHKGLYSEMYDLVLTEISSSNIRSMRAHEKVGFKTIHTHHDAVDEWNVVVWDWS